MAQSAYKDGTTFLFENYLQTSPGVGSLKSTVKLKELSSNRTRERGRNANNIRSSAPIYGRTEPDMFYRSTFGQFPPALPLVRLVFNFWISVSPCISLAPPSSSLCVDIHLAFFFFSQKAKHIMTGRGIRLFCGHLRRWSSAKYGAYPVSHFANANSRAGKKSSGQLYEYQKKSVGNLFARRNTENRKWTNWSFDILKNLKRYMRGKYAPSRSIDGDECKKVKTLRGTRFFIWLVPDREYYILVKVRRICVRIHPFPIREKLVFLVTRVAHD